MHKRKTHQTWPTAFGSLCVSACAAALALLPVATYAQTYTNEGNVPQETNTTLVPMSLNGQSITQLQGANTTYLDDQSGFEPATSPAVILTPGTTLPYGGTPQTDLRTHVTINVYAPSNFGQTVKKAGAHVYVVLSKAPSPLTTEIRTDCVGQTARTCMAIDFNGMDDRVTIDQTDTTGASGIIDVPVALPYFAQSGTWSVYWKIVPVDVTGTAVTDQTLMFSNINLSTGLVSMPLNFYVGGLIAIDVSPNVLEYKMGGGPIAPGGTSDPVAITVSQKGNVQSAVRVFGTNWTCYDSTGSTPNGQTMPVAVTKFRAGASGLSPGTNGKDLDADPNGANYIRDDADANEVLPESDGLEDGTVTSQGAMVYQNSIVVPAGVSGQCRASFTNIASDNTGSGATPVVASMSLIGSISFGTEQVMAVATRGNYAYVTTQVASGAPGTFHIIDVSNKAAPQEVGTFAGIGSIPNHIALVGNYAFVLNYWDVTVSVLNISNPSQPIYENTITLGSDIPQDLVAYGNNVYVTKCWANTMLTIDADPASPNFATIIGSVGNLASYCPQGIAFSGNYAYVTAPYSNLVDAVDITNPSQPTIVTQVTGLPSTAQQITVIGSYAYLGTYTNHVAVLSLDNPASPTFVGGVSLALPGTSADAGLANAAGKLLVGYNGGGGGGVAGMTLTNAASPVLTSNVAVSGQPQGIATDGTDVYYGNYGNSSLEIYGPIH